MREICHLQAGQCGNQIGAKVIYNLNIHTFVRYRIPNNHAHPYFDIILIIFLITCI
jgi:hypothetical protein